MIYSNIYILVISFAFLRKFQLMGFLKKLPHLTLSIFIETILFTDLIKSLFVFLKACFQKKNFEIDILFKTHFLKTNPNGH